MGLSGLAVPTPTVFDGDGRVDPPGNQAYVRSLCLAGIDHLFALGSLGEFTVVDDDERRSLLNAARDGLSGASDLWVGVGAPSTRRALRFAHEAEDLGASVLLAVPPYYLTPTEAAIASYYRQLAQATSLPLLAYNIPAKVGYRLTPALVHALAEEEVLHGIKDTSGALESVLSFLSGAPAGFAVLPGDDSLARRALEGGAAGAVMGLANIAPGLAIGMLAAAHDGDGPGAAELDRWIAALARVVEIGPFPSTIKFLAHRMRATPEGYRSPYDALTEAEAGRVLAALAPIEDRIRRWC